MSTQFKIHFLGGAGTVTGSKFLVVFGNKKIMVECGMFQGLKNLRLLNRTPLPFDPKEIDAVIITHAHLDHTGHLPLLVKQGYSGKIYCSEPTREVAEIILRDSAKLQEEDAIQANRGGYTKHHPALPLYDTHDAERTFSHFRVEPLHQWIKIDEQIKFRFQLSGHILGSVFVELDCDGERIVFSGDLGRAHPLTLNPPARLENADYLLIESTYGDRKHSRENVYDRFAKIIHETVSRGGQILIPCFAVGRTQDILHILAKLKASHSIPNLPIYLDSPMAIRTTQVFDRYPSWHKLGPEDLSCLEQGVTLVSDWETSKKLQEDHQPAIIIAGSGMMAGGRILSHAYNKLRDARNTFVMVGFQAAGTLGRFLRDGSDELKIFGEYVSVKAKVEELASLSAHADQSEIIEWLRGFSKPPKKTFIVHGEPHSADALRVRIRDALGWDCVVPVMGSVEELK